MWTRKELKDKAKVSFKANYWKSVLVALVLVALMGGMSFATSYKSWPTAAIPSATTTTTSSYTADDVNVEIDGGKIKVDVDDHDGGKVHVDLNAEDFEDVRDALDSININDEDVVYAASMAAPGIALVGFSLMLALLVVSIVVIALYVFVLSPLEVGAQRFFIRNLNQRADVKEVTFGYDNNYKENVKTLFLRSLFIFLWSLLLIIPGIYKAYEYRMIPYLLAEDPTMTKDRAFAESKRMMDGQKWNTFVLDLSFLGWNILSALTLGILGAFYVAPYQAQTNAALYEKLRYGLPAGEPTVQAAPTAPTAPVYDATAQTATAPVITPESQPPVPPFAQVGAQPVSDTAPMAGQPESAENSGEADSPQA